MIRRYSFGIKISFITMIACSYLMSACGKQESSASEQKNLAEEVSEEAVSEPANAEDEEEILPEVRPEIKDMVTNGELCITLCEDGSVWGWKAEQGQEYAAKYAGLENIVTIKCAGPAMYALSQEGDVYVWGSNELFQIKYESYPGDADKYNQLREQYFDEPVKVEGLADIVEIDVSPDECIGRLFAADEDGRFYVSGMYLYQTEAEDLTAGFPEDKRDLVEGVKKTFAGTGSYHYFIREDGTVFSIMDYAWFDRSIDKYVFDFIFPQLPIEEHEAGTEKLFLEDIPYVDLRKGTKFGITYLYELGKEEGIECIGSDRYTMFLSRNDGTLWYWNSGMIKLHDHKEALVEGGYNANYAGNFCQVDVDNILEASKNGKTPQIVDICAGKENVTFLTDDGQVFISNYVTYETANVPYHSSESSIKVDLKTLAFEKLDWENIISINTDGEYHFTAVDEEGNYYVLDMAQEEVHSEEQETAEFLTPADFAVTDGQSEFVLDQLYDELKIDKEKFDKDSVYVGIIKGASGFSYDYFSREFEDLSVYTANVNFDLKDRDIGYYYVAQITLKTSTFKTPRGITIGSSMEDVLRAYGQGLQYENENEYENGWSLVYSYNDLGLFFEMDQSGIVRKVNISIRVNYE